MGARSGGGLGRVSGQGKEANVRAVRLYTTLRLLQFF